MKRAGFKAAFAVLLTAFVIFPVQAAEFVWKGTSGGTFSEPSNWQNEAVPGTGDSLVFPSSTSGTLVNDIANFRPSCMVFKDGIGAVTVSGNSFAGLLAITNLSTSASVTFLSPVAFADGKPVEVYYKATYSSNSTYSYSNVNGMIFFKGGVSGYEIPQKSSTGERANIYAGEYRRTRTDSAFDAKKSGVYRNIIYRNSSVTADKATDLWELGIDDGGAFTARVITVRNDGTYNRLSWRNDGEIVATEEMILTATGNKSGYLSLIASGSKGNVYKAKKLTVTGGDWVRLSNKSDAVNNTTVFIGEQGIVFDSGGKFSTGAMGTQDGTTTIRPWRDNFEIGERSGTAHSIAANKNTVFNTDNEKGEGKRITINATLDNSKAVSIAGSGTVRYNRVNSNTAALTVSGSATLELGAGAKTGTGAVTVNAGTTLSVPESGTGTVGGTSALKDGCALSFRIRQNDCGVLSFAKAPAVNGAVTVKLAEDSAPLAGKSYVLTSNANLSDISKFALSDGVKGTLSVENGELVYTAPKYFCITVR